MCFSALDCPRLLLQSKPWVETFRIDEFYNMFMWRYEVLGTYTLASLWPSVNNTPLRVMPNQWRVTVIAGRINMAASTLAWGPGVADASALPAGQPAVLQLVAVDSYGAAPVTCGRSCI